MGQVLSIIWGWRFMPCANGGSKGGYQTPTDDHDPVLLQEQPAESHSLTIYDPLLVPSDSYSITGSNGNTPTTPCTVLDFSRVNDVEDEEKVVEVVVAVEQNPSNGKKKWKKKKKKSAGEKVGRIGPYTSSQKILLVGEGDFSFSACLAVAFGTASNMIATSLNTKEFLLAHYGKFSDNNKELETKGCTVLHSVDATTMAHHPLLWTKKFDRIVYNFPHSGFRTGESADLEMGRHQSLLSGFLRNAKTMIDDGGEIHVTHKSNEFFLKWNIPKLASDQGLYLIQEVKFKRSKYPGYHTKYGFGGDKDFDCTPSKTYYFGLASTTSS